MSEKYIYNLLVIDDETEITKSIFRQFRKTYNVFTANSAGEAIAIMEKENIQLVISDQRMPGITGLDFFGLIKDKYPDAVKIMLSGYSDLDAIIGAINEGQVFRYISKPWNPTELSNLLIDATQKYELITKNKRLAEQLENCNTQLVQNLKIQKERLEIEERLNLVIKGSNDAPWDWDFVHKKIYYSPQWWSQIGYKPDELAVSDQLWYELLHPEDRKIVDATLDKAVNADLESYQIEFRLKHKDGHNVSVLSRGFITRDDAGNILRISGTNMDLTERKKANMALQESEEKYRSLVENAGQPIFQVNKKGEFVFLNSTAAKSLGYSIEQIIGKSMWDFFPKEIADKQMNDIRQVFANEKDIELENTTILQGEKYWFNTHLSPLKDSSGKVNLVQAITLNINERKHAEDALRISKDKFEILSNVTFEGILIHDKGVPRSMNNSFSKMFGYTQKELANKELIPLLIKKEFQGIIRENIKNEYTLPYEVIGIKKDGTEFPIEIEGKTYIAENNERLRVTALRDITERKQAEEDLRESESQLKKAQAL